ncbi:glycerate kinase [Rhodococcus qingshengii]|nr:glycerate kinase [Rhodococcus qingshengii]
MTLTRSSAESELLDTPHERRAAGHVVVAPDKFKGSASAADAASAIARGLRTAAPNLTVVEFPIADGGEGTVEMMIRQGYTAVTCAVIGPMQQTIPATYALRGGTAVIEMASAAGLAHVGTPEPTSTTARTASTRGVGQLMRHALDRGAQRIVLGVGGSATTDGGAGALTALGARILDSCGDPLYPCGQDLADAAVLDIDSLDPRLGDIEVVIACDVDNPLTGPRGAAAVYGPQKGADSNTVTRLEHALGQWADVVSATVDRDLRDLPGAGAAGGLAFAMAAVLGAQLTSGIDLLLKLTCFTDIVDGAACVIVGEGSLDAQSLRGKGPVGVARAARQIGVPTVAVVGRCMVTETDAQTAGFDAVFALNDLEPDAGSCMTNADFLLEQTGAVIVDHRCWDV